MGDVNFIVLFSENNNIYYNLAVEKLLLNKKCDLFFLFLWQASDTVVLGMNQNPFSECDLKKLEKDGVKVSRRITGGGAVFHDLGNVNFSFIAPKKFYDEAKQFDVVLSSLKKVGINAELTGRNDVAVSVFKVSGNAFYKGKTRCIHHGTLLVSSDLNKLSSYLTPSHYKLEKRGVSSVKSRVKNLVFFNETISPKVAITNLYEAFCEKYPTATTGRIEDYLTTNEINEEIKKISSTEYIFSKWSRQKSDFTKCFDWGICSFEILTDLNGKIVLLKIDSDCLFPNVITEIEINCLQKKVEELLLKETETSCEDKIYNDIVSFIKEIL